MCMCRGGGEQFLEETDRSVHDALMIVKRALTGRSVVAGGGAIEMELSSVLRKYSRFVSLPQPYTHTHYSYIHTYIHTCIPEPFKASSS